MCAPKGWNPIEDSYVKDYSTLKSVRKFGSIKVRKNEYERICISL